MKQYLKRLWLGALLAAAAPAAVAEGEHRPVFSPDGSKLVFMSQSGAAAGDWELFLMDIGGGTVRRLTDRPGWDGYAVWSPDGTQIIFDRQDVAEGSPKRPVLMDIETGDNRFLKKVDGWLAINDWHDDRLLAFWEKGGQRDLYLLNLDGSIIEQVTDTPNISEHDAHFSPDGQQIAFASGSASGDGETSLEVITLNNGERTELRRSPGRIYGIDWAPDGGYIAFTDAPDGDDDDADIFFYQRSENSVRRCTDHESWDHMPVWAPDGRSIIFTSYRTGTERLYTTNCQGTELRLWTGLDE